MSKNVDTKPRASLSATTAKKNSVGKIVVVVLLALVAIASLVMLVLKYQTDSLYDTISKGIEFDPDNIAIIENKEVVQSVISKDKYYTQAETNEAYKSDIAKVKDNYISNSTKATEKEDIFTYVLYGLDAYENGQADIITLVSVNKKTKQIHYVSIAPNSLVFIPEVADGGIVGPLYHAYDFGGGNLLVKTISQNFGIYIHGYAELNMEGAEKVIGELGSVKVSMTADEIAQFNKAVESYDNRFDIEVNPIDSKVAGEYELDVQQVMAYIRGVNSERQTAVFTIMKAAAKQAMNDGFGDFKDFITNILGDGVTVAMDKDDFDVLVQSAMFSLNDYLENGFETYIFGTDTKESKSLGGVSYTMYDYEDALHSLTKEIY
ncbi:MAG: LCP family protein [Clostridia bacterium]|nr:LCP family protein [Clostridia bacterium]